MSYSAPQAAMQFAKIHIEISNICNLQCSFCPAVERKKGQMSLADFTSALDQVAPLAKQVCLHLMGEPLLHPDFPAIAQLCQKKGVRVFLVSNGVLLKERHHEILLMDAFEQLNFSLHSFRDNFGDTDPRPYLKRIFKLTEEAFEKRPDLYINYRLWNLQDPRGESESNRLMLRLIEEHFGVRITIDDVRRRKNFRIKNRLYLHWDTEFVWPSLDLPELGTQGTCKGLTTHIGILVDGTVVPCCLDKEGLIPLGNIREKALTEILADEKARTIKAGFEKGILLEGLCQRCNYIDRFKKQASRKASARSETALTL